MTGQLTWGFALSSPLPCQAGGLGATARFDLWDLICRISFAILARVQSRGDARPSCLLSRLAPDVDGHGGQPFPTGL